MKPYRLIYHFGTLVSQKAVVGQYSLSFCKRFRAHSAEWLNEVIPNTLDIGNTIFSFNYACTPAYTAWWKAACEELTNTQAGQLLWSINESIFSLVPRMLTSIFVRFYLNNFRKKAPLHEKLCAQGAVHPYDYRLTYKNIGEQTFEIHIHASGMRKLAEDFGAERMFPAVCRIDYMMFHL